MAFEFHYQVYLAIAHRDVDPQTITRKIVELVPEREVRAGSISLDARGQPRIGADGTPRRAMLSVWSAPLHQGNLWSGDVPFDEFIGDWAERLAHHRPLFDELSQDGQVRLHVNWFNDTTHSATDVSADVIAKLAAAGLGLELNYYGYVPK